MKNNYHTLSSPRVLIHFLSICIVCSLVSCGTILIIDNTFRFFPYSGPFILLSFSIFENNWFLFIVFSSLLNSYKTTNNIYYLVGVA